MKQDLKPTILSRDDIDNMFKCDSCKKTSYSLWHIGARRKYCDDCMTDDLRKEYYSHFEMD